MLMKTMTVSLLGLLAACATTGKPSAADTEALIESMQPHRTEQSRPVSGALGSSTNPVRVLMPEGERAYLARLRCPNGGQPKFERQGSGDIGPYGRILDFYSVECSDGRMTTIAMDMYHCIEDDRAVPGFDLVPELDRQERRTAMDEDTSCANSR